MLYRQHQVRRHCSLETEAFYDSFFKSIQQRFEERPNIKDAKKSDFLKESFIHLFYKDKIFSVFSQYCVKVKTLFMKCRCLRIRHSDNVSPVLL